MLETAASAGFSKVTRLGLPDDWILQASRREQLVEAGLDTEAIGHAIRDAARPGVRVGRGQGVSIKQGR